MSWEDQLEHFHLKDTEKWKFPPRRHLFKVLLDFSLNYTGNKRVHLRFRVRVPLISNWVNSCKFWMYIYLAGIFPISCSFFFYLDTLISHLKSVCGDKIPSDNNVVGQCVLLESLTSLVLPQGCFSPILHSLGLPVEYKTSMVNPYVHFWLSSLLITWVSFPIGTSWTMWGLASTKSLRHLRQLVLVRRRESLLQRSEGLIRFQFYFDKLY